MNNRKMQYWVIPPEADAEFVAHMEDVLETYAKPYNPLAPVLCMDEQPVQLVKDVKVPIAATKSKPQRVDYEYERAGVANVFMFTEPLSGWREVAIREQKTKVDWALAMAELLEGRYAACPKVILVCDDLNTHTMGAFYEVFEPERARSMVRRKSNGKGKGTALAERLHLPVLGREGQDLHRLLIERRATAPS
jgi:hypothetical protein